jgi:RHS repeat-associated protein
LRWKPRQRRDLRISLSARKWADDYRQSDVDTYPTNAGDINTVGSIVIEDAKSGSTVLGRNIYGLSLEQMVLRQVSMPDPTASSPAYTCVSMKMRNDSRVLEYRMPSAHLTSSFSISDFLNPYDRGFLTDPLAVSGQIFVNEYDNTGQQTGWLVKQGSSGTAYYLYAADYGNGTSAASWDVVATYEYPTQKDNSHRSDGVATNYGYTYQDSSTKNLYDTITITGPAVDPSQNGSNVSAVTVLKYDLSGRLVWVKDPEGYLSQIVYTLPGSSSDEPSGQPTQYIVDAAATGSPSRGSGLPTALALTTSYAYDNQGRLTKTTDAGGGVHYQSYFADRFVFASYVSGSSAQLPVTVDLINPGNQSTDWYQLDASAVSLSITSDQLTGISGDSQSNRVSWIHYAFDPNNGRTTEIRSYHLIPTSGDGSSITNYYATTYGYDFFGRVTQMVQDVDSSHKQEYDTVCDFLGRPTQIQKGVQISGSPATLATVFQTEYDNGGVGDGYVTKVKSYFGTNSSTDYTSTVYHNTYRGHVRGVELQDHSNAPLTPVIVYDLDWMGRQTAAGLLNTNPTWSNVLNGDGYSYSIVSSGDIHLRELTTKYFDTADRIYRAQRYIVSQSDGSVGASLRTNLYYDQRDQLIAMGGYNQAAVELAYDGAGRQYQGRVVKALASTLYDSGGQFQYRNPQPVAAFKAANSSAMSGGNEGMISLVHDYLDAMGNVLEKHSFEVNHNDTDGLSMADHDYVRNSIFAWYDNANRPKTFASYGCGDTGTGWGSWKYAAMPTYGTAPAASDQTMIVAQVTYDTAGRQATISRYQNSSKNVVFKTLYDSLGRQRFSISNYVDFSWTQSTNSILGTGDSTNHEEDNVVGTEYNGLDQVTKLTAYDQDGNGGTNHQITQYVYGDTYDAGLATLVAYPDGSTSGSDNVQLQYALDGLVKQRTDQCGVVLGCGYNDLRQLVSVTASTIPSTVDNAVKQIGASYDALGRLKTVTSYSDTSGSTPINQIQFDYDDFGKITKTWQDHNSTVTTTGGTVSPAVSYVHDYADNGSGLLTAAGRLKEVDYPTSRQVFYGYGSSGSFDQALSRPVLMQQGTGGARTDLGSYLYSGLDRLVEMRYNPSGGGGSQLYLDRFDSSTPSNYSSLDRFGRIGLSEWKYNTGAGILQDGQAYDHDLAGNRTIRDWLTNHDQTYSYDGLDRLTNYKEGALSGSSIPSPTKEADWTLDALGNWAGYSEKTSGTTTLAQTRAHNLANEVGNITVTTGSAWWAGVHDAAGNMTDASDPRTSNLDESYKWDAFNRLVSVNESGPPLASFTYDGLGRRITKTVGSTTYHYYLSNADQVLEERTGATTVRNEMIWHPTYVDALAMRFTSGTGYYAMFDANFNVTAMASSASTAAERYGYTPYGQPQFYGSSTTLVSQSASTIGQENLYTGRQYDPETGLYYYRSRYYHPSLGRFIGRDPIRYEAGDANLYNYVLNNPEFWVDPSGTALPPCWPNCPSEPEPVNDGGLLYYFVGGLGVDGKTDELNRKVAEYNEKKALARGDLDKHVYDRRTQNLKEAARDAKNLANVAVQFNAAALGGGFLGPVTFGHGFRHLEGTGMSEGAVETAITQQVRSSGVNAGSHWGWVQVEGKWIQYRGFLLPDGTINVGTYFPVSGPGAPK